ncbi:MAG: hypothetical protein ABI947_09125 [Chloroflexota bacterium]
MAVALGAVALKYGTLFAQCAAEIKAHLSEQQRWEILTVIRTAVVAAQQSGLAGLIENIGRTKKAYAFKVIQDILDSRGIPTHISEIDAQIEVAVATGLAEPLKELKNTFETADYAPGVATLKLVNGHLDSVPLALVDKDTGAVTSQFDPQTIVVSRTMLPERHQGE